MRSLNAEGASSEIGRIMESAERLGVEVNEAEALQWLAAMASWDSDDDVVFDPKAGVYGHTVTMLDFSSQQLEYYRRVGKLVEFEDEPGVVACYGKILGDHRISISGALQHEGRGPDNTVPVVIITHITPQSNMTAALDDLAKEEAFSGRPVCIRIVDIPEDKD